MSPARRDPARTFLSFSQLLLQGGGPQLQRPKVSYIEVEILDQRTGAPVSVIDKVHPSSTVLDLKNRFHKACPGWLPSRTGLKTDPNGPFLADSCVMETVATSSLVSVYPTDLGRQVGWTAVFLSQYFGPLLIYLAFYLRLSKVYEDAVNGQRPVAVHLACFCHSLHYIKHLLETLFVHKLSNGSTPLRNLLKVLWVEFSLHAERPLPLQRVLCLTRRCQVPSSCLASRIGSVLGGSPGLQLCAEFQLPSACTPQPFF